MILKPPAAAGPHVPMGNATGLPNHPGEEFVLCPRILRRAQQSRFVPPDLPRTALQD